MLQRHAVEKLHGDESLAFMLANVVDGADVGMIQCRGSLRLPLKPTQGLRIAGYLFRQELQGDKAAQAGVFGFVNHAHPASAQLFDNSIVRDGLANHVWDNRESRNLGSRNLRGEARSKSMRTLSVNPTASASPRNKDSLLHRTRRNFGRSPIPAPAWRSRCSFRR